MKTSAASSFCVAAAMMVAAGGLLVASDARSASTWNPGRNVEIVVPTGVGSSQDLTARLIQSIWINRKTLSGTSTITNRPGAVAIDYLQQKSGDAHYLYIGSAVVLTNHMTGKSAINYTDLTTVGQLFEEYIACIVRADSELKSGTDVLNRLRKDPSSLSIAFATSLGNTNHVAIAQAAKAAGIDPKALKVVLFKSGGEAMTALLGGHIDIVSASAGTVVNHITSGRARALAISAPQRMTGSYASVPTWRELGAESVASNWRNIFGSPKMNQEQIFYWEQAVAKAVETDEWKRDLEKRVAVNAHMSSRDSVAFLEAEYARLKSILTDLGIVR